MQRRRSRCVRKRRRRSPPGPPRPIRVAQRQASNVSDLLGHRERRYRAAERDAQQVVPRISDSPGTRIKKVISHTRGSKKIGNSLYHLAICRDNLPLLSFHFGVRKHYGSWWQAPWPRSHTRPAIRRSAGRSPCRRLPCLTAARRPPERSHDSSLQWRLNIPLNFHSSD